MLPGPLKLETLFSWAERRSSPQYHRLTPVSHSIKDKKRVSCRPPASWLMTTETDERRQCALSTGSLACAVSQGDAVPPRCPEQQGPRMAVLR